MYHQVFESESSRVWTGALGTPLHAIENAEQHEMELIASSLQIWLKTEPKNTSVTVQSSAQDGLYLVNTRRFFDGHLEQSRSIFLPIDALSCFSIYSPSPFVSIVLVVLEVASKQQQGYFFGRLRQAQLQSMSGKKTHLSDDQDHSTLYDMKMAEKLLAALHSAFPKVKLSRSATKCLFRQEMGCRAAGKKLGGTMKRRKTLSADAFYGSNTSKQTVPGPSNGVSGKIWRQFYEKLQFRVSHSVTCQLEGTSTVSLSFPRQQEAFEFADQVAAFRQRVKPACGVSPNPEYNNVDHVPRVFSFERAGDGKRRFLVTSLADFWKTYKTIRADQRHVYEIIREGVPCRLYFDLEFKRAINTHVDGNALVTRLLSLIQLQRRYGIRVQGRDIYQLESSTPAKFSRHIIVHLPGGDLFEDNLQAGAFVRELINDLIVLVDDGDSEKECPDQLYSPFLVNTESENDSVGKRQLFIDTSVYTRNRMFRILGSSKFKKHAVLRLLNPSSSLLTELDQGQFANTLVCPYQSIEAVKLIQQTKPFRLFRGEPSSTVIGRSRRCTSSSAKRLGALSVECRSSVYPVLDAFILSKAATGGVQGEIRAIQMLLTNSSSMLAALPGEISHKEQPGVKTSSRPYPWMIIYHMARNRWCANIRRPHRSNNIMFVVDIDQRVFYQKCHDPTCQAIDFRSPPQPLPLHINFDAEAVGGSS
ncbi:unnamed protein product [Peronospora belbahrii]|uniref:DNA-directed primase/polymerase protein n=1 Tax=Peronospora belbahrii TaxID=622444 RepID=A0AAU9L9G5_9STRA|nr:unnamed protein product [Peronospora belbahrii]